MLIIMTYIIIICVGSPPPPPPHYSDAEGSFMLVSIFSGKGVFWGEDLRENPEKGCFVIVDGNQYPRYKGYISFPI